MTIQIEALVVSPFQENCYLVSCNATKEAILIDPGDEANRILKRIKDLGLTLKFIANTHSHVDHASAVASIKEQSGVPFYLSEAELPVLKMLGPSQQLYNFGDGKVPTVDEFLVEGKTYQFGEVEFSVIATPGHTVGGVCFYFGEHLFVGDTLFQGSIGRTDLPTGDYDTLIASIQTKLMVLDEDIIVYSGHGGTTTIGQEKHSNPFLV